MSVDSLNTLAAPPADEGSIGAGCLWGCLVQVIAGITPLLFVGMIPATEKYFTIAAALFGVTQWLVLGPLIRLWWTKKRTIVGIIIIGSLGTLLSSTCGMLLIGNH